MSNTIGAEDSIIQELDPASEQMKIGASSSADVSSIHSTGSRVLHFSDGTLLVDEEDGITRDYATTTESSNKVGIRHSRWRILQSVNSPALGNIYNMGATLGRNTLKVVDYVGGGMASMLGITDPKYANEISKAEQLEKDEKRRSAKINSEMASWSGDATKTAENQV